MACRLHGAKPLYKPMLEYCYFLTNDGKFTDTSLRLNE